jgi:hypothetical protein
MFPTVEESPISQLSQSPIPTNFLRHKLQPLPPIPSPSSPRPLLASLLQPPREILTLADIKHFQDRAAFNDSFYARAGYAHTPPDRELAQFQEVQPDRSQRRVRDGGTAEG